MKKKKGRWKKRGGGGGVVKLLINEIVLDTDFFTKNEYAEILICLIQLHSNQCNLK